ncbi:MAG: polysaccharide pyruvyl transferase family protein [Bacilli bacterium]
MKKVLVFDPSYGTLNNGDFIIKELTLKEMNPIIGKNFVVNVGTHNPIIHFYQLISKNDILKYYKNADIKFLFGTNILKKNLNKIWTDWNVNLFNFKPYIGLVLIGAGSDGNFNKINFWTRILYKKMLNNKYYHSVRDESTKLKLESLGLKAINTGCPTLWSLTEEHCLKIPVVKSEKVIFTLTDYNKDYELDKLMIDILFSNYKEVYFWIQGAGDLEYLEKFENYNKIKLIGPTLSDYNQFLNNNCTDYVGTRLHAGIYAIKAFKRSIIISIDNRASDMSKSYNLNTINRTDIIDNLECKINEEFETLIKINKENIEKWKNQFKNCEKEV